MYTYRAPVIGTILLCLFPAIEEKCTAQNVTPFPGMRIGDFTWGVDYFGEVVICGDCVPGGGEETYGDGCIRWEGPPPLPPGGGGWDDSARRIGLSPIEASGDLWSRRNIGLVFSHSGAVHESKADLLLPSKGRSVVQWKHHRTFEHQSNGPGDTSQGYHWFHTYMMNLVKEVAVANADADITWRSNARRTFLFNNTGSYTFDANDDTFAVLSHEHAGDPADTYRIEFPDGTLFIFYDFDHSTAVERGNLKYIKDLYGNRLSVFYDGSGRIDYITDPSGHHFRYTYLSSGDNSGKLDYIRVFKSSGTTDADLMARVEFTYQDSLSTYDDGVGEVGDLIRVVVKTRKTSDTGANLSIVRTVHYRYWENETFNDNTHPGHAHELKFILRSEHFDRAEAALTNVLTATDAQVDDYATYQFEYDSSNRCDKQTIAGGVGGGGGCCGGGGSGAGAEVFELTYTTQSSSNRNDWAARCKITHNGTTRYMETNNWGELFLDVLFTTDDANTDPVWIRKYDRDTATGQVTKLFTESCFTDYDVATNAVTTDNDGLVFVYTYDANAKRIASKRVRKYSESDGSAKYLGLWEYTDSSFGYRTLYHLDASYVYPTETTNSADSSRIQTDYQYVFYVDSGDDDGDTNSTEDSDRPLVVKVIRPTIPTSENGPNVAVEEFTYIDDVGRPRWTKDAEGNVDYQSYNNLTGNLAYTVSDVNTGTTQGSISPIRIVTPEQENMVNLWATWTGAAPKDTMATPAYDFQTSSGVKRETKRSFDRVGRLRWQESPDGDKTYFAYNDSETITYPNFDSTTDKTAAPIRRVLTDEDGRTEQTISIATSMTVNDPPNGATDLSGQTNWVAWTKTTYDGNLQQSSVQRYHTIPTSGDGSSGTNYYEMTYSYAADNVKKVKTVQVKDHEGGYTRTTTDAIGRRTKLERTTQESMGSPTGYVTITEWLYDQATPGTGDSRGRLGLVTQVKSYYDSSNSNSTSFTYDFRRRLLLATPPNAPYTLNKYDNLSRMVASATYSTAPASAADPTTTSTNRLRLNEMSYDKQGRVYQTERHEVLTNGTLDSSLTTDTYYDRANRRVAIVSPGGGAQITEYNGAGEVTETQIARSVGSTIYSSGAFDYTSDNPVIEMSQLTYDSGGRVIETNHWVLEAGASGTIDPAVPGAKGMASKTRAYYDDADRNKQNTSFGTYADGGVDGPMNGSRTDPSPYNASSPETASPTVHVSTSTFDTAGRLQKMVAPDGMETTYEYDDLGRRTKMTEDAAMSGKQRVTLYAYDGNGKLTKITAEAVGEYDAGHSGLDNQVTEYKYEDNVSSVWLTKIHYPGSDGQPSTASADTVTFTYNVDGTVATRTDQNSSVITYDYDTLRRKTHERVTAIGSGVDNAILQLVWTYDSHGRISGIASRDSSTKDSGTVGNEVEFTYNGYGQLIKDEQEYDGLVDGSTLAVEYAWTENGTDNHSRLDYVEYPNDRKVYMYYGAASSTDDAFSRVAAIRGTASGDAYVAYTFAGLSELVGRKADNTSGSAGNDTFLDYDTGTDDEYNGKDIFGRVVSQLVSSADEATTRDDIDYEANEDGSPKFADQAVQFMRPYSAIYTYDTLNRLTNADVGVLNSGQTAVISEWSTPQEIDYTMDILGNFTAIDYKNSGASASQTRTHNATNEIVDVTYVAESVRKFVDDDFADNDTVDWAVADITGNGANNNDGTWSASSGQLQNDTVVAVTGAPDSGNGSVLLVDEGWFQDVRLSADIAVGSTENAGLVFGYQDHQNFWVILARPAATTFYVYEVSAGTWTLRTLGGSVSGSGGTYSIALDIRAGAINGIVAAGTLLLPAAFGTAAGQVGVWAGAGSAAVKADNFVCRDMGGQFTVDGRFTSTGANVRVNSGALEFYNSDEAGRLAISGIRMGVGIVEVDMKVENDVDGGIVLHYQNPSNYNFAVINDTGSSKRLLLWEVRDGKFTSKAFSSTFSLTDGQVYGLQCKVTESGGNQTLSFACDTDQDGSFSDETPLSTGTIDDTWSGGFVGLGRTTSATSTTITFDDFKAGDDQNADGDIADAGDHIWADYDFNDPMSSTWQKVSFTYDNNGNLTNDGVRQYVYDGWNRLAEVYMADSDKSDLGQRIASYEYDGRNRRMRKVVENRGTEYLAGDGGNTTMQFYYAGIASQPGWNIIETRDGSDRALRQWLWGWRYTDELVLMDVNSDPSDNNDCSPDTQAGSETAESELDRRYFYHQDRNWNVIALTGYQSPGIGGSSDGKIEQRISYTPYGTPTFRNGTTGAVELVGVNGSPFLDQGLLLDKEKDAYQNRWREYGTRASRYLTRDPIGPIGGNNRYALRLHSPLNSLDPAGLMAAPPEPIRTNIDFIPGFLLPEFLDIANDPNGNAQIGLTSLMDLNFGCQHPTKYKKLGCCEDGSGTKWQVEVKTRCTYSGSINIFISPVQIPPAWAARCPALISIANALTAYTVKHEMVHEAAARRIFVPFSLPPVTKTACGTQGAENMAEQIAAGNVAIANAIHQQRVRQWIEEGLAFDREELAIIRSFAAEFEAAMASCGL